MSLLGRFKQGRMRLTRIEAFSDGVFAIIVTLLVLELKVPALKDHASAAELAHHLVELLPKFLSWLISFIIVCKFWLNHHHVLGLARQSDYAMVWLNSIFLLGQSFIPFPTAVVGEYPNNRLAVFVVRLRVRAEHVPVHGALRLHRAQSDQARACGRADPHAVQGIIGPASYLLGAALAWVSVHAAFAIYALTPLFYITPRHYRGVSGGAAAETSQ